MHVVDEEGKKMSKSAGNVIDPQDVIERFGGEAFRIWSGLEGNITTGDIRCSFDRIRGNSKFLTKLWNIARFVSSFPQTRKDYELAPLDKMILSELNKLIGECRKGYEEMNAFISANAIRNFAWNIFADHYIEAAKSRAYNREGKFDVKLQRGAWYTLHKCLETILKLLAPICPFITEAIWLELYSNESIHIQTFPEEKPEWESELNKLLSRFMAFNNVIWRYKKEKGFALSQNLPNVVYAPKELEPFKDDLMAMHRIAHLRFEEPEEKEEIQELAEGILIAELA